MEIKPYESESDASSDTAQTSSHGYLMRSSSRILKGFRKTAAKRKGLLRLANGAGSNKSDPNERDAVPHRNQTSSMINRIAPTNDIPMCETGYMADTECSFTESNILASPRKSPSNCLANKPDGVVSLPCSPSNLSLHRIRQGNMVHKLIVTTYVTTFLGFIVSLLHLYTLFGSYEIFGNNPQPDPWPWLLFQTFQRLVEFGMGASIGVSGWWVIQYRHQRYTLRRRQQDN